MLFSEGCYLDTFLSGLQTNAPYYQEITDIQRITLHNRRDTPAITMRHVHNLQHFYVPVSWSRNYRREER